MKKQNEYNILLSANCLSTLDEIDLNKKLVASLYDIDTKEKISDGENKKFEILDYNFTSVIKNNQSLDLFIVNEIKKTILQIIDNNGYNKLLFDPELFNKVLSDENFKITEYEISRIYTLAEIYFQIMQKPTEYAEIIEYIVAYDVQTYK